MFPPAISGRPSRCYFVAPALFLCVCLPLGAQIGATPAQPAASTLPATPTTAASINAAGPVDATTKPHHAEVAFTHGQLTVRANNSSLHQILRSISTVTGMTIAGGVAEQRVFGSYGPGDASTILATLLDGTGVNMFIREGDSRQPTELILTPRSGAPGSPITAQDEQIGNDEPVSPPTAAPGTRVLAPGESMQVPVAPQATAPVMPQPVSAGPPSAPRPLNNPLGSPSNTTPTASQIPTTNSVPTDTIPTPTTAQQPAQGIVDSPNPPPANSGTPLTPDQVYQKILQMQKANGTSGTTTTPPPTPPQGNPL